MWLILSIVSEFQGLMFKCSDALKEAELARDVLGDPHDPVCCREDGNNSWHHPLPHVHCNPSQRKEIFNEKVSAVRTSSSVRLLRHFLHSTPSVHPPIDRSWGVFFGTNIRIPGYFLSWTRAQGCHRTSLNQAGKPPPLSTLDPENNQQGFAWSRIYLEIGILIEVANLERGHGMIKTQSVGISNRHRFAVMVYLSPLVHPETVNVGVQDHLQGPGRYTIGWFCVTSKNGIIRLKISHTSTIFM